MMTLIAESAAVTQARRVRIEWQARRILMDRTPFSTTLLLLIVVGAAVGFLSILKVDTRLIALLALATGIATLMRAWVTSRRLEAAIALLQLHWEMQDAQPHGTPRPAGAWEQAPPPAC